MVASSGNLRPVPNPQGSQPIVDWFEKKSWQVFDFQKETWQRYLHGYSGLIHASTGTGKTYAIWPAPLIEWMAHGDLSEMIVSKKDKRGHLPLTVLWLTPLRALANDIALSLEEPVRHLDLPFTVETRTGDTSSSRRAKQKDNLPSALVTTPESLSILLSYENSAENFKHLKLVVVDEWHELIGNKRGVQVELALARLRKLSPDLRIWGLSATIGNLDQSLDCLLGNHDKSKSCLVQAKINKEVVAQSVLPASLDNLPWTGHTGLPMIEEVIKLIDGGRTSIVFTNVRSQTEQWYQRIIEAREDFCGIAALHHGSLDAEVRRWVELALKEERLKFVVSTSSLDLGVDFSPVDRVVQIGSPKGVARAMQRAGRSGHSPGLVSKLYLVPSHALELVEMAAARIAISKGNVESRYPLCNSIDVLCQHVVTIALGTGFEPENLYEEVRRTHAFRDLTREDWNWVLNFVGTGGTALKAYPEYQRIRQEGGCFIISDKTLALKHRLSIGTIVSDQAIEVCFTSGERIGQVEESFISRLKKGDRFIFAGRYLELVEVRGMKARVRISPIKSGIIPRWMGGRLPLSSELAYEVRLLISQASEGDYGNIEMTFLRPLLELQAKRSSLPELGQILVETYKSRDGYHLFVYPFEGRLVNEGIAILVAYQLSRISPSTYSIAMNDWGFEILSDRPILFAAEGTHEKAAAFFKNFRYDNLADDIRACLNSTEMAKRQFREIARVAGLIFQGYPGANKTVKQVQVSSGLLYDVFVDFDPGNLLVRQAHDEVLERHLEISRMIGALSRLAGSEIIEMSLTKASPFCLPLMVDRLRGKLTSEKLAQRILRMQLDLAKDMRR
jgi:ATP-dependent Lhr-like helicase